MRRSAWFSWVSVGLMTAVTTHSLVAAPPKGHDAYLHYFRIPVITAMWQQGVLFSRWQPDLLFGYGSPLLNFYPPLTPYLLTLLYWLVGQQGIVAYNLAYGLALAVTAAGIFGLGQWLYGRYGGLLVMAAYMLSPHLLYQTYERGSLSNAWAMALLPWAVWGGLRVAQRPTAGRMVLAALGLVGLLLAHTAVSFMFLVPWGVWMGTAVLSHPAPRRPRYLGIAVALLLGLGLTAVSWLPALTEISHTHYAGEINRVDVRDFFADPLRWPPSTVTELNNAPLPKSPGLGQIGLGLAGTVLAAWAWRKRPTEMGVHALPVVSGLMGMGGLFLAMPVALWCWEHMPLLLNFQYPWRFLDLPTFGLALAAGWLGRQVVLPRPGAAMGLALVVMLLFANAVPYFYPPRLRQWPAQPTLADVTAVQQQFGIYGLTGWGEYADVAVTTWPAGVPFAGADAGATLAEKLLPGTPVDMTVLESSPWRAEWRITGTETMTLTLAVHVFPGWQATVDGQARAITPDGQGRIQVAVPAGEHLVRVWFGSTPIRRGAAGVTVLAGLLSVGLLLAGRWGKGGAGETAVVPTPPPGWGWLFPAALLCCLLGKVAWLDRADSPWLVHVAADGTIPGVTRPTWGDFDGRLRLVGYEMRQPSQLTLYWQGQQPLTEVYTIAVTLADARGVPVKTWLNRTPGSNVTTTWQPGEITRDSYMLSLEQGIRPIGYQVRVGVQQPQTGAMLPLRDSPAGVAQEVTLGRWKLGPGETAVPETAVPLQANFNAAIRLTYADFPAQVRPTDGLPILLVWESETAVTRDYTVFIHLLDEDGQFVLGNDGQPTAGIYPTSYWSPGETIWDQHDWWPDLPPGRYQLQVGLYDLSSGVRLPVSGAQASSGDQVLLGWVESK